MMVCFFFSSYLYLQVAELESKTSFPKWIINSFVLCVIGFYPTAFITLFEQTNKQQNNALNLKLRRQEQI